MTSVYLSSQRFLDRNKEKKKRKGEGKRPFSILEGTFDKSLSLFKEEREREREKGILFSLFLQPLRESNDPSRFLL